MYEAKTYESILSQMINAVNTSNPNIDTREGSIIYTALAPAAVELANMYIELDNVLNESFADTQTRDFLIRRASERGVVVKNATPAIRKGEFTPSTLDIPIGSRFSLNMLNYKVIEKVSNEVYKLECESAGIDGNNETGALIPIDYIDGLETATLTDVLIPGEDEEDTESLRQRYLDSLNSPAFGGNVSDYKNKTKALQGVGGVKVYPTWNGGGTVKLVIINSSYESPSSTFVDEIQTAIDPVSNQGEGIGLAPIGHVVTVVGVSTTTIDISTTITLKSTWTWEDVLPYIQNVIDKYFLELAKTWEDESALVVRISQIESRLLDLEGIIDIENTKINNETSNLVLNANNIPVRGEITNVSQESN